MTTPPDNSTLTARATDALLTADPAAKAAKARQIEADYRRGNITLRGDSSPPARPGRPERPLLLAPRDMPKRRAGRSEAGRIALLHALAHIELNAIDLALDIVARFAPDDGEDEFASDWLGVAAEEAVHFELLARRLNDFGAAYGDLPAHDGLWEAAEKTADDLLARLAVVPLVLEARGLDVTPSMIERIERFGDRETSQILEVVYREEIGHVACGRKWFGRVALARGFDARKTWQELVMERFRGDLKPPFNIAARDEAGLAEDWYAAIAAPLR